MPLNVSEKNRMLGALIIDTASLHTSLPGLTGANELAGGSPAYARKSITLGSASAGTRISGAATFDIPPGTTVRWVGLWSGSAYSGFEPNGSSPKEFLVTPSTDVVNCTAHGYSDGTKVVFYNGTIPAPLVEGTVYFTRDGTTDSFKVAATAGGAAIDLTNPGSTDCIVSVIAEDSYSAQDTHTLTSVTIGLLF